MDIQKIKDFQTETTELLKEKNLSQEKLANAVTTFLQSIENNKITISATTTDENITTLVNNIDNLLSDGKKLQENDKNNLIATLQLIRDKFKDLEQAKKEEESKTAEEAKAETEDLKKDILSKLPGYSVADLQTLKGKSWKELWSDAKYMQSLQYLILASGAKDPSMDDRHLQDQIYGKVTKAGVITIQNYLNTTYQEKLNPDWLAGPATLAALLKMDGETTRREKILTAKPFTEENRTLVTEATTKSTATGSKENDKTTAETPQDKPKTDNTETPTETETPQATTPSNSQDKETTTPQQKNKTSNTPETKTQETDKTDNNPYQWNVAKNEKLDDLTLDWVQPAIKSAVEVMIEENWLLTTDNTNNKGIQEFLKQKNITDKKTTINTDLRKGDVYLTIWKFRMILTPDQYLQTNHELNLESLRLAINTEIEKQFKEQQLNTQNINLAKYLKTQHFSSKELFTETEMNNMKLSWFLANFDNWNIEFDRYNIKIDKKNHTVTAEYDDKGRNQGRSIILTTKEVINTNDNTVNRKKLAQKIKEHVMKKILNIT